MKKRKKKPLPPKAGSVAQQVLEDLGVPDAIPKMTPAQVAESRARLLASRPFRVQVSPPRVPERFVDVRFETTVSRRDVSFFKEARAAVLGWVEDVAAGRPNMLAIVGPKGTSKSHLIYCAAWALYERHNVHVPCFLWYELVDQLRSGRSVTTAQGTRQLQVGEVREQWYDTHACIVDEVRPTSGTDFDAMELAKFSMQRYDRNRSVLLTCNWMSLESMMGEPAADRYTIVTLNGPSFR